jgi:hypothetical protein
MFRIIASGNSLPYSWPLDINAEFQPGMISQLTVLGNQVVATVSNGTAPIGIIDDIRTKAFTAIAWDETVIASNLIGVPGPNNTLVIPYDIKMELNNPNVMPNSFISIPVDVQLIPRNGVIIFPAGTALNYDLLGTGTPNAIKTNVRYCYQIPNIVGDDSTQGSQRVTVWYQRMIAECDQFETNQVYPVNANLFVSELGLLTTRQASPNLPSVAIVTAPPTPLLGTLQFLWL